MERQIVGTMSQPTSVLIIDDNLDEQLLMQWLVRRYSADRYPVGAVSATQALTYLSSCLRGLAPLPELILLDLYLPNRQDGWRVLRRIRSIPACQHLVVIVISHSQISEDIEQAYSLGANAYVIKPATQTEWVNYFRTITVN